jgi:CubicO group peptidase (beta-lactamase class C family)/D-alanyl-D-alanine dipeptidase
VRAQAVVEVIRGDRVRRPGRVGHVALLGVVVAVSYACAGGESAPAADDYAAVVGVLTPFIEHERAAKGIPAISIALVDDQKTVWTAGFGWADSTAGVRADARTIYRVGSVSKLFTDLAVMRLVATGELDLDAPVSRYLPDFHPANPFGGEITLRRLTSHLSGLTREPPVGNYFDDTEPSLAETVGSLDSTALVYAPGTHTKYSNAGIAVLGYVLEKTRGESFYPYLKDTLLEPMGLESSAFQPLPDLEPRLAKGYMWSYDGLFFEAPTFQLGIGPAGSMYTSVEDLARFESVLFNGGRTLDGRAIVEPTTLEQMWTPQEAPGARTGFGIGFHVAELEGHRLVGHDGAIYGFATNLSALPDDKLGVVVVATLDGANAVTDRIAEAALRLMLARRSGGPLTAPDTTHALAEGVALGLAGRWVGPSGEGLDLSEYEGRLYGTPTGGGERVEVRAADDGGLMSDGRLAYGPAIEQISDGRLRVGADTLGRVQDRAPGPAPEAFRGLIGEYGWDHDKLYILEKGGRLTALIEWFFEYPLRQVSDSVFAFPSFGLYDGQEVIFHRGGGGQVTGATVANVLFQRRPMPGDDNAVSFRIEPVRPVAELRAEALAAEPPVERGDFVEPDLVELRSVDPAIRYEIRYATANNFMGTPFYTSAHAFMQRPAAQAVARADSVLGSLGYGLLVHDAYRPWYVTKMFWDGTPVESHQFVADPSQGSRHNRGAAVDLTLYERKSGEAVRMTGGYDEMSERSYPLYPGGTSLQRWRRDLLRHAMEAQGFNVYEFEWWHFDYRTWRSYPILNLTFEDLALPATRVR